MSQDGIMSFHLVGVMPFAPLIALRAIICSLDVSSGNHRDHLFINLFKCPNKTRGHDIVVCMLGNKNNKMSLAHISIRMI